MTDSNLEGTLQAIKEAGRREERARIIQLIATIKDNWQRTNAHNYRAELFNLIQLIEETK